MKRGAGNFIWGKKIINYIYLRKNIPIVASQGGKGTCLDGRLVLKCQVCVFYCQVTEGVNVVVQLIIISLAWRSKGLLR